MPEDRIAHEAARQSPGQDAVKSSVERRVNAELAGEAAAGTTDGHARVAAVAGQMRDSALDATVRKERVLGHSLVAARGSQFLDYAFFLLYGLLAIRLVLAMIAANSGNGFVRFIGAVTAPFFAPFRGIVPSVSAEGGFTLVVPILIAIVAYGLLHAAINALLRMVGSRKTAI